MLCIVSTSTGQINRARSDEHGSVRICIARNLLNDGVNTYTYDAANRLIALSGQPSAFSYNGLGNRLQQTISGQTTRYALDINTSLPNVLSDGSSTYTYGLGNLSQSNGTATDYFLGDALGSTRQLTDATGQIGLSESYEPFGNPVASAGTASSILGYAGQQTDISGLQFLRARYYQPMQGRFLNRDSFAGYVDLPQSLNRYVYGLNDPVRYTDPSGNCFDPVTGLICAAAIGALIGGGINLYQQLHANGGNWDCIDWSSVAISAGVGAVAGLVGVLAFTALLPTVGVATLGDFILAGAWSGILSGQYALMTTYVLSGQSDRILNFGTDMFNPVTMTFDAALGAAGGAVGYGLQSFLGTVSGGPQAKLSGLEPTPASGGGGFFADADVQPYRPSGLRFGQERPYSCVAASCRMLLGDQGITEAYLRRALGTTTQGTYLYETPNALESLGQPGYVFRTHVDTIELGMALENGPALVQVTTGGTSHVLVVDAIEDGLVAIRDPLPARSLLGSAYKVALSDFLDVFSGLAVLRR